VAFMVVGYPTTVAGAAADLHMHRIPLVSPFGHYRSQTWHRFVLRVNRRHSY
jgi:hypothetical protein